jgi:Ca2+-transporting ATPase
VIWSGLFIGLVTVGAGFAHYESNPNGPWQTLMFTMIAIMQVFQALGTRSNRESLFSLGLFTNPVMVGVIALVVGLQVVAVYAPFLSTTLLRVQPLGALDWLFVFGAGVAMLLATEAEKWWSRRALTRPVGSMHL